MTKEQAWQAFLARNKGWSKRDRFTFSIEHLKRFFEMVWDLAEKHGREGRISKDSMNMFEQIFGVGNTNPFGVGEKNGS